MAASVFVPASPNCGASGSAPTPKLSSTIKNTRFAIIFLLCRVIYIYYYCYYTVKLPKSKHEMQTAPSVKEQ